MPRLTIKQHNEVVTELSRALSACEMKTANFSRPDDSQIILTTREEIDSFVKDRVRIYLNTWISDEIETAIHIIKSAKKGL